MKIIDFILFVELDLIHLFCYTFLLKDLLKYSILNIIIALLYIVIGTYVKIT